jgi:eukaryotic-like serine/threonine-protein kinase
LIVAARTPTLVRMDAKRWCLIEEHFHAALALWGDKRAEYVAHVAQSDPELRMELESLLGTSEATSGFLDEPVRVPYGTAAIASEPLAMGSRLGAWRILRLIGYGGMGEVYEAERADAPFEQRAALKLTNRQATNLLARFNRERRILARLDHPGIARLLDGGVAPDGRPYAAMEYVEGLCITESCRSTQADLRARLAMFLQVCDAVSHAHRNLVVHRDIKPANVLVDSEGRVRLLDFGIAKALDAGLGGDVPLGATTALLTPDYAAPEQLAGDPVTTATDVYALGVLLFELLTGRRPWAIQGQPFARALNTLLHQPAPRMSELAAATTDSPISARLLQGDLDAIVAKCLRQEPQNRYVVVEALVEDLRRFLDGRAVLARAGSTGYRMGRFIRRHRLPVAAGAAVVLALAAGLAGVLHQAEVARAEAHRAEAVQDFLISIFRHNSQDQADPLKARATTARELLAAGATRLEQDVTLPPAARDRLFAVIAQLYTEMDLREKAAALVEQRIPWLRERGDTSELARALVEFAENVQETNRHGEALPALREAERLVLARKPVDEALAGYVFSYLSNQLNLSDPPAAKQYAARAVILLRNADPSSEAMLGALFMLTQGERVTNPRAAERSAREALQVARALYGEDHTLYADAALFLADIEASVFENAAAELNFREADRVAMRSTDPHHYLRLQVDLRFGQFLVETGRLEEGWMRLNRVLSVALASRGEEDRSYTAWAREYVARASYHRGLLREAREVAALSLATRRRNEPSDLLARTAELMFDIALAAGDVKEAEALIKEARAARDHVGSSREPGFLQGLLVREGDLALTQGDAARALQLYGEVSRAEIPPLLQFLRYRVSAQIGRSRAELSLGRLPAAAGSAQMAIEDIRKLGSPAQLKLLEADAWQQLGGILASTGACPKADEAWAQSLAALTAVSDPASFRFEALRTARGSTRTQCQRS